MVRLSEGKIYQTDSGLEVLIMATGLACDSIGSTACAGWFVGSKDTGLWKQGGRLIKSSRKDSDAIDLVIEKFDELLNIVTSENRIYPNPAHWDAIWQMLPEEERQQLGTPMILGAAHAPDWQKAETLRTHLEAAARNDLVNEFKSYLDSLDESDWTHSE